MNESSPNKTTSTRSFDEWLEDLGVYEAGKPAPGIEPLYNPGGSRPVGLLWQSEDIASNWEEEDGPAYWNSVRLALPDHGIVLCGYSFTYTDLDDPSTTYISWNIFWKQTSKRALHKHAIEHASKPLRSYTFAQLDALVNDWSRARPWFVFDLTAGDHPSVRFWGKWLQAFLERVVKDTLATPKTRPKDRKPFPRILEAIYTLDPRGLVAAIRAVVTEDPDSEDVIRQLIPKAFHAAALDKNKLSTADELADEFYRTKRTILRVAKARNCKPRVGKHGLFRFTQKDAIRIYDAINAERTRA